MGKGNKVILGDLVAVNSIRESFLRGLPACLAPRSEASQTPM